MRRLSVLFLLIFFSFSSVPPVYSVERIERLKSRVKRGVNFYRDGRFTISKLTKQGLGSGATLIRGLVTNDTNRRAVSVQLEVTCYDKESDLIDSKLFEINYLDSRQTQPFKVRIREREDIITLFEANIQDVIWDEF